MGGILWLVGVEKTFFFVKKVFSFELSVVFWGGEGVHTLAYFNESRFVAYGGLFLASPMSIGILKQKHSQRKSAGKKQLKTVNPWGFP